MKIIKKLNQTQNNIMQASKQQRSIIIKGLQDYVQLDHPAAVKYENEIHDIHMQLDSTKVAYNRFAYDAIGLMKLNPSQKTLDELHEKGDIFESELFNEARQARTLFLCRLNFKPVASKGVYFCKNCGSDEFYLWTQQTRSMDEGSTQFRQCKKCGKRGKE